MTPLWVFVLSEITPCRQYNRIKTLVFILETQYSKEYHCGVNDKCKKLKFVVFFEIGASSFAST